MPLAKEIATMPFPVYGIVGNPFDLTSDGLVKLSESFTSILLDYTSPRYPSYPNEMLPLRSFRVVSHDGRCEIINRDGILPMVLKEQAQPVRTPFIWEGTLNIAGTPFIGAIRYYAAPLKMSGYNLKSEKSLLKGVSYGPSCDEVIELLEGLQVLNGRDDVLRQDDNP